MDELVKKSFIFSMATTNSDSDNIISEDGIVFTSNFPTKSHVRLKDLYLFLIKSTAGLTSSIVALSTSVFFNDVFLNASNLLGSI